MAVRYEEDILEPELKPSYIEKIKRIEKQKNKKVGSLDDLRKRYEQMYLIDIKPGLDNILDKIVKKDKQNMILFLKRYLKLFRNLIDIRI